MNSLFQVFVPSSSKTLHLYEARFLSLLEEVLCYIFHHVSLRCPSSSKFQSHAHQPAWLFAGWQVMAKGNNLLAHIVIEPVKGDEAGVASFVATYGCLARIESVSS